MARLPVLVVSADRLARAGLATLVSGRAELELLGEARPADAVGRAGGAAAVLWSLEEEPVAEPLGQAAAQAPVVALVTGPGGAADALRAGARGLLWRGAPAAAVAAALLAVAEGLSVVDPAVAGGLLRAPGEATGLAPLTPREHEVLGLLAEGRSNKEIAAGLAISEHTAKFHVNAILEKLGAGSRAEAIVVAARAGLIVL